MVSLRDGESFDSLLKRFRASVVKDGIISEYKRYQSFMTKSEKLRAKMKRAQRKQRKQISRAA